jgi:hypothetical protein
MKTWIGVALLLLAVFVLVAFTAEPAHPMRDAPGWTPATVAEPVPVEVP